MPDCASLLVPIVAAAVLSACGGRGQDEGTLPDGNLVCAPPDCPNTPEGGEQALVDAGPSSSGGGPAGSATGTVGGASLDVQDAFFANGMDSCTCSPTPPS